MAAFRIPGKGIETRIILAGIASLFIFLGLLLAPGEDISHNEAVSRSSKFMQKAIRAIQSHLKKSTHRHLIDTLLDPNETGLIGPARSAIATTLGNLYAKRTTTNPNFAGLIAFLLKKLDLKKGDTIAIGCSASFPSLMLASLSAAHVLKLKPVVILSMGSSSYGATNLDLTILDLYMILYRKGLVAKPPDLVTIGGEKDIGADMPSQVVNQLKGKIRYYQLPSLTEPDLRANVSRRLKVYSRQGRISAFINIGGSHVNLGTSSLVLRLKPGINRKQAVVFPLPRQQGMIFEMLNRDIPVIHLLFIKGIAQKYHLPWDPIPLPKPGTGPHFQPAAGLPLPFVILSGLYLLLLVLIFTVPIKIQQDNQT